ncbi:hypothetical protein H074_35864 [Amycolatopsis decaplanina DSM 44594]|uniref:Uncharacterized protein n=1 Tax=Amycolatopsis decaplanina DSM 44594 TaxID=1284240 RepID=M2WSF4_9PSEU|nr:hypothetical protein H074_35864 [Amycolatopsis decaplanina DSM 44594]
MRTTQDHVVAAAVSVDVVRWQALLGEGLGRVAGRFARVEPRRRAGRFVAGLLSGLSRVNCWTIAERVGDRTPDEVRAASTQADKRPDLQISATVELPRRGRRRMGGLA